MIGPLDEKHKEIYEVVLTAQLTALDVIGPELLEKKWISLAGKYLNKGGYGEYFGHGIGQVE